MQLTLMWNKCQGGDWCRLFGLNLDDDYFDIVNGVYIIWLGGSSETVLRVGQGFIREQLYRHQWEDDIREADKTELYVTWTPMDADKRAGIVRFLAEVLKPKVVEGDDPKARPIIVNLPGQ